MPRSVKRFADLPFIELAPDWVLEVLSPGTEALDRSLKMPRYAEAGVHHAWLIDPRDRVLEVYRARERRFELLARHETDAVVRAEPFDAVSLELALLWS